MKAKFDNAGFSRVQTRILELPTAERVEETTAIRQDPAGWILQTFLLTEHQQDQLAHMDADFLQQIVTAAADAWEAGSPVSFDKETRADKDQSAKDFLFSRQIQQYLTFGEETVQTVEQVTIWIRYR